MTGPDLSDNRLVQKRILRFGSCLSSPTFGSRAGLRSHVLPGLACQSVIKCIDPRNSPSSCTEETRFDVDIRAGSIAETVLPGCFFAFQTKDKPTLLRGLRGGS
ncbi:hypothetical protein PLANTIT3_70139 [Plantibacter sp. T3]|nr:hypothetical protein PLANTIT3_70139 [Plantibacter sp. T3]